MAHEYTQHDNQTGPASDSAARDCAALESLLTAFFDGECSAAESAYVRAHLETCADCTRACQQWQSTRALFQIQAVPLPPASLLARVRLAYQRDPEITGAAVEAELRDQLLLEETLLEAARGLEPEPFTPVLRAFFAEAQPPASLKAEILKNTVGASVIARVPAAKIPARAPQVRERTSILESLQSLLNPGSLRWAGALAVPAMAAWLILASSSSQLPLELEPEASNDTPRTQKSSQLPGVLPGRDLGSILGSRLPKIAKLPATVTAPKPPAPTRVAEVRPVASPDDSQPAQPESTPAERSDEVSAEVTPEYRITRVSTDGRPIAPLKTVEPTVVIKPAPKPALRVVRRPRFDTRIREVNISERAYSQSTSVNSIRMASLRPVSLSTPPEATQRVAQTPNRVAINFKAAVEEFRRLRSNQDDELRGVLNDYRASLVGDEAEEAPEEGAEDML